VVECTNTDRDTCIGILLHIFPPLPCAFSNLQQRHIDECLMHATGLIDLRMPPNEVNVGLLVTILMINRSIKARYPIAFQLKANDICSSLQVFLVPNKPTFSISLFLPLSILPWLSVRHNNLNAFTLDAFSGFTRAFCF